MINIKTVEEAYLATALTDIGPMASPPPISGQAKERAERDVNEFVNACGYLFPELPDYGQSDWWDLDYTAGYLLWLTRTGAGTGFWDHYRSTPDQEAAAALCTEYSRDVGEIWAYLGDDGKMYLTQ